MLWDAPEERLVLEDYCVDGGRALLFCGTEVWCLMVFPASPWTRWPVRSTPFGSSRFVFFCRSFAPLGCFGVRSMCAMAFFDVRSLPLFLNV